ncbi:hypothetical protein BWI93_19090 [Siphonobacter sp. BAB-5385]|uniref:tape measure protein n=1 Tax=Siphonobacter sp. BAB-5385 TaxID=1864822 RepID=UPI000B9EB09B|nr:tape measure protein [Siphonobacter sp. BAB-5385]OZI06586.1 hypothetical protein BWI93_19090 [Siphonobacter sp. BAB-5385]
MASRINVGITGDNSGLQTSINDSKRSLKDFVADFSRKASELNAISGKVGDAQRKLVLGANLDTQAKAVGNTLGKLNAQINVANGQYQINGDRIAMVQAKTQAYTAALNDLLARGLKPDSDSAKALSLEIRKLNAEMYVLQGPQRMREQLQQLNNEKAKAAEAARRLAEEEAKAAEKAAEAQRRAAQKVIDDRRRAQKELVDITRNAGRNLTLAVTAPLAALTTMSLRAYGELDALRRGLAVVEGNADKAMQRQKDLKQIYALPGLGIQEALRGDVLFRQAGGYSAAESFDIMKQFGNAIALGGGGKEQFGLVLMQLTQMSTKTKVLAEDLKPLINQAPVAAGAIRKLFGTVDSEQISKQLQAAGKGPREFISMLTAELAKAERVTSGFKNGVENLQDSMTIAGDTYGRVIDQNAQLSGLLSQAANGVENLAAWFEGLNDSQQTAILATLGVAAAMGPTIYVAGTLAGSIQNLANAKKVLTTVLGAERTAMLASLGPYAALAAAVALVGAGTYALYKLYNPTIESAARLADVTDEVTKATGAEIEKVKALVSVAGDEKKSKDERAAAVDKLKAQYPDYFGKLDSEKLKTDELKSAYDQLAGSIYRAALARAAESKANVFAEEIVSLRLENQELMKKAALHKQSAKLAQDTPSNNMYGPTRGNNDEIQYNLEVQKIKNNNAQIYQNEQAIKSLTGLIEANKDVTKTTQNSTAATVADTDSLNSRKDATEEATKELEKLLNVEAAASKDRRTLNEIEVEGLQEIRRFRVMNIDDKLKEQLITQSILATERKLADARREMALDRIYNRPKLTPSRDSVTDYLAGRATSNAKAVMDPFNREQKSQGKLNRYAEIDQIIAAANGIDLSKPLNGVQRQLMDFIVGMNETLRQGAVDAMVGMGEVIGGLIAGTAGIQDLPQMLLGVMGGMFQMMGKSLIEYGIVTAKLIPLMTNIFTAAPAAIIAGVALTALGAGMKGAVQKRQKFASGGIAYGRIFGVNAEAGEYSNARTNPEVIAPLRDLTGILKPFWVSAVRETAQSRMATPGGSTTRHLTILNLEGREIYRTYEEYREKEGRWAKQ